MDTITTAAVPELIPDLTDPTGRADWLTQRRTGIGGSDIAAIIGLSPWTSAFEVWASKRAGYTTDDNEPMRWGRLLEPVIAAEWAHQAGEVVVELPVMWRSTTRPWAIANVDRLIPPTDNGYEYPTVERYTTDDGPEVILGSATELLATRPELLEVKSTGHYGGRNWEDDQAPLYYQTQVQHYLDVLGLDAAWLVCLVENRRLEVRRIWRDNDAIEQIRELVDWFWATHVEADVAPEADVLSGSVLKALHPDAVEQVVDLPPAAAAWLERRRQAMADIKAAEKTKGEADARFMQWLGDAHTGQVDGATVVTWNESAGRLGKDYHDALERSLPPARLQRLRDAHRPAPSRRLHFKAVKP